MRTLPALTLVVLLSATAPAPAGDVVAVGSGDHHILAVMEDGAVRAWGANESGQLGDGTTANRHAPVAVKGLPKVRRVAAGKAHSLALTAKGELLAWGANEHGQLGDGTVKAHVAPVAVDVPARIVAVDAGEAHTVALDADGRVWTWGWNHRGQLGDGTTADRAAPVCLEGIRDVVAIAAGDWHTLALKKDRTVWVWGANNDGRLGDGTTLHRSAPVRVAGLMGVAAIAAGRYHSAAALRDGTTLAWGCNWSTSWQLADGTTLDSHTPVYVTANQDLPAWGTPIVPSKEPHRPLGGVALLAAGAYHTLAIKTDGTVWGWGQNFYWGQLGEGQARWLTHPVKALYAKKIVAVAAGRYHSVALDESGDVWISGCNMSGQLGNSTTDHYPHATPVMIEGL